MYALAISFTYECSAFQQRQREHFVTIDLCLSVLSFKKKKSSSKNEGATRMVAKRHLVVLYVGRCFLYLPVAREANSHGSHGTTALKRTAVARATVEREREERCGREQRDGQQREPARARTKTSYEKREKVTSDFFRRKESLLLSEAGRGDTLNERVRRANNHVSFRALFFEQ